MPSESILTDGIAGLFGGLMLGVFADPKMIEYGCGTLDSSGQVVNTSTAAYPWHHEDLHALLGGVASCTRARSTSYGRSPVPLCS